MVKTRPYLLALLAALAWAQGGTPAAAAVKLGFLSRDLGDYFPHAFVEVSGATDADPATPVHDSFGFTAASVSPSLVFSATKGKVDALDPGYIRHSDRHFSITLTDAQYAALLRLVEAWRTLPGKSYDLHKRNCVSFVAAVAREMGLRIDHADGLLLKPRSFLDEVAAENPGAIEMAEGYVPKLGKGRALVMAAASAPKPVEQPMAVVAPVEIAKTAPVAAPEAPAKAPVQLAAGSAPVPSPDAAKPAPSSPPSVAAEQAPVELAAAGADEPAAVPLILAPPAPAALTLVALALPATPIVAEPDAAGPPAETRLAAAPAVVEAAPPAAAPIEAATPAESVATALPATPLPFVAPAAPPSAISVATGQIAVMCPLYVKPPPPANATAPSAAPSVVALAGTTPAAQP